MSHKNSGKNGKDKLETTYRVFQKFVSKKRHRMGLSRVRRSPGIPSEAKCEGDGVGRYDGSWPDEVTHLTQWPDLSLRLLYKRNPRKRSETVNLLHPQV